jgi:hypothetical protein
MSRLQVLCLVYGFVGIVAAASPFPGGGRAHAQGFDCRRAADAVDRAICNTPELATLDSRLCAEQSDLIGCVRDAELARITQLQAIGSPLETDAERAPQANSPVMSPAIGMPVSQILEIRPGTDCSDDMCEFSANRTPQRLCPSAGACDRLVLFLDHSQVVTGYQADFSREDWSRSLNASTAILGPAKKETVGPSGVIRARSDFWSWRTGLGQKLEYTAMSGVNMYGAPLDVHNIRLTPAEAK